MIDRFQKMLIGFFVLSSVLFFQNCTPGLKNSDSASGANSGKLAEGLTDTVGGGDGYDGKLTYINRADEKCADGNFVRIAVEVLTGSARLLRKDCQDVAPAAIAKADFLLMPHNQGNAIMHRQVFDLLTPITDPNAGSGSLSSRYLCRGEYENKNNQQIQVADVVVRYHQDGKAVHSVLVIMAVYEADGTFKETLNSGTLDLRQIETGVEGRLKYVSTFAGRHQITLWMDKEGEDKRTGKLSFIDLPYAGRQNEPNYNFRDYERVIQNLNCYSQ